jgi:hypothetical protein
MKFEPKNREMVLQPTGNLAEKIQFLQSQSDAATQKINHFDTLRQQLMNYSIVVFSGFLAFVIKTDHQWMQVSASFAVVGIMLIFRTLDHRYHRFTHGFTASVFVFKQAIAYLLDNPGESVTFRNEDEGSALDIGQR